MSYKIEYTAEAEKDIDSLKKSGDKATILKLRKLLVELMEHPYNGTGKPEPLKHGIRVVIPEGFPKNTALFTP